MDKNILNQLSIAELELLIQDASREIAIKKSQTRNSLKDKTEKILYTLLLDDEPQKNSEKKISSKTIKKESKKEDSQSNNKISPQKKESEDKKQPLSVDTNNQMIKYRDPNNPQNTWTGRGRIPIWMMEAIRSGAVKEDFLIKK